MGLRIMGTGGALPARSVTNDELSAFLDTSDEWIRQRTGIRSRRVCTTETLDELAVLAAERAMEAAGVVASDLDLILCTTTSGDHLIPSEACAVQVGIGASCPAFDISAACAGFVYALDVADGWFARGRADCVLVVSAEKCTRIVDWQDRATCVLFGDGAGAAVLGRGDGGLRSIRLATMGDLDALSLPGVIGSSPFDQTERDPQVLSMQGHTVFKFGVTSIVREVRALAADGGMKVGDIDHFVFHQANDRILDAAIRTLGIDSGRVVRTLAHTGNISSACIPVALDALAREGGLRDGDHVAIVGFGAGLCVGSCLIDWEPARRPVVSPPPTQEQDGP